MSVALAHKIFQQCGKGGYRGTGGTAVLKRTPTTMWRLLIWAYRRQMVQYETDRAFEHRAVGQLAKELLGYSTGDTMRGCINGAGTTAHEDAHVVHAHVMALKPRPRYLLIDCAARAAPPNWSPAIPPHRFVPSRKAGTGTIRMIWRKGNAVGCLIEPEGIPELEAALIRQRAREAYVDWWQALRQVRLTMVHEHRLGLWRVSGIGAEDRPWNAHA